jgi:aspartyl-tRNA(Asn)/glutamyl-tRNA(Gln) amidotransferase subunit A
MGKSRLTSLRECLLSGSVSAEDLALGCIEKMERMDGGAHGINAIGTETRELALALAKKADGELRGGGPKPAFLGIPIVVKDNMACRDQPLKNGSRITEGLVAPFSATVLDRLISAGAVPVARAAMDEFAMGSSGEFHAFGPTRNPWDASRVAGGSSSGSAAAVAAGYVPFALGSDTGGSIRLPAAFCGISAFRPTYGVLSRYGVTAMASSLDQAGPMARHVEDLALGVSVMAGLDPMDSTSLDLPRAQGLARCAPLAVGGLRVGYFAGGPAGNALQPKVRACVDAAVKALGANGAEISEIDLPGASVALETYCLLNTAEASSNLSRFDGFRCGAAADGKGGTAAEMRSSRLGREAKRRILLGTFCLSKGNFEAYYLKAMRARRAIAESMAKAFESLDYIAAPVSPVAAFPLGEKTANPLEMYMMDILTVLPALAGMPALAVPAGLADGLPVGVQFMGPRLSDCGLLRLGHAFQQMTDHHEMEPPAFSTSLSAATPGARSSS